MRDNEKGGWKGFGRAAVSGHQERMEGASGGLSFPAASPADFPPPDRWNRPHYLTENIIPKSFISYLLSLHLNFISSGEAHCGPGFASMSPLDNGTCRPPSMRYFDQKYGKFWVWGFFGIFFLTLK